MNKKSNQQLEQEAKSLIGDIKDKVITFVESLPDLKERGLKLTTNDCNVESVEQTRTNIQGPGESLNELLTSNSWKVYVSIKALSSSLIVIVDRYWDGGLEVVNFYMA